MCISFSGELFLKKELYAYISTQAYKVVFLIMPFFKTCSINELALIWVYVRIWGLFLYILAHEVIFFFFLLVILNLVAFLLNVTSTVMFWMSACQSILCTVHLTWSLCCPGGSFMSYVVVLLTGWPQTSSSPGGVPLMTLYLLEDLFCGLWACMAYRKTICPNQIPQKIHRKKQTK